jgi:serine/threonine protein kinase
MAKPKKNASFTTQPQGELQNYTIVREIGSGGMAMVYEAYDNKLKRTVAIKALHPHLSRDTAAAERFKREALSAARMDHPNIVRIYDYFTENKHQYIVMEYVPGTSMEAILKKKSMLGFNLAFSVMSPIATALAEAHSLGIMHRDIKPANILLHARGRIMLSDFGLARHNLDRHLTVTDGIAGTPPYMSPEQLNGQEATLSSDVYSWAVTFYHLCAGRLPYSAQEFPDIIPEIQKARIVFDDELMQSVPGACQSLLKRCLTVSQEERVHDGMELMGLVSDCSRGSAVTADITTLLDAKDIVPPTATGMPSKTDIYMTQKKGSLNLRLAGAGLIILLMAGSALFFLFNSIGTRRGEQKFADGPVRTIPAVKTVPIPAPEVVPAKSSGPLKPAKKSPAAPGKPTAPAPAAIADSGNLFVFCDPWATVYINGQEMGKTPLEKPIALQAGKYKLKLSNDYCEPFEEEVTISAGVTLRKRYALHLKAAYNE